MRIGSKTPRAFAVSSALAILVLSVSSQPATADCSFSKGDPAAGDKVYHETCVACHGEDGHGAVPGVPDFAKRGGVLGKPHQVMSDHIKKGFSKPGDMMAMPPKGGNPDLNDKDIEDVHSYLHKKFGCG